MSADITRHVGDTGPPITASLVAPDGTAENLTSATVVLHRTLAQSNTVASGAGTVTITDATNGAVSYAMTADDNATVGTYHFWFTATLSSGQIRSYGSWLWQVLP